MNAPRAMLLEPPLPLDVQQPSPRREKPSVYEAVRILRLAGHVVRRQGSQHSFDGKIAGDRQLIALAEAERGEGSA